MDDDLGQKKAKGSMRADEKKRRAPTDAVVAGQNSEEAIAQAAALLHDLRTPLFTIRNLAQLIPPPVAGERDLGSAIAVQVDRMNARLDLYWQTLAPAHAFSAGGDPKTLDLGKGKPSFSVLYVDDDALHRDIGERLLRQMGHKVTSCTHGGQALVLCKTYRFDVIFLDQHSPVMLGTEVAAKLVQGMEGQQLPYMIGMSNDPRVGLLRQACLDIGMQDFLEKPVTERKIEAVLSRVPSKREV